jgi:hypothetical protein
LSSSPSSPPSPKDFDSEGVSFPCTTAVAQATLLSLLLCFRACYLSFTALLASCLATSSSKVTPRGSLHTHPRPCSMRAGGVNKARNQHNRVAASSNGLIQGLPTPSLREAGPGVEGRCTPRARSFQTQASTSVSISSMEKE